MNKNLKKVFTFLLSITFVMSAFTPSIMASTWDMNNADSLKLADSRNVPTVSISENVEISDVLEISVFDNDAVIIPLENIETDLSEITSIELRNEISFDFDDVSVFSSFKFPDVDTQGISDVLNESRRQAASADSLLNNDAARFDTDSSTRNTNPNIAIQIPDSYFGLELLDLANHEQRWYYFNVAANRKVTSALFYQSGVYALGLYKLNGANLELVASSLFGGGSERLHYISQSGGIYFLAALPINPTPNPHLFSFYIEMTNNFDSYELNNFFNESHVLTNSINIHANLDSRFDEDWFQLNVTTAGNREIALFNAPSGQYYAVFMYDSNLNSFASFYADNNVRTAWFAQGTYYIRILTLSGQRVDSNYWLNVTNVNQKMLVFNGNVYFIEPGQNYYAIGNNLFIYSVSNNMVFINGNYVVTSGSFGNAGWSVESNVITPSVLGNNAFQITAYGQTRICMAYDVRVGFLRQPAPALSPPFWYWDGPDYYTGVYGNQSTRVSRITVYVCLQTRQIFHAFYVI